MGEDTHVQNQTAHFHVAQVHLRQAHSRQAGEVLPQEQYGAGTHWSALAHVTGSPRGSGGLPFCSRLPPANFLPNSAPINCHAPPHPNHLQPQGCRNPFLVTPLRKSVRCFFASESTYYLIQAILQSSSCTTQPGNQKHVYVPICTIVLCTMYIAYVAYTILYFVSHQFSSTIYLYTTFIHIS